MPRTKHIPAPPNDGRSYKFADGKYVAVDQKQAPPVPASERRAKQEAAAAKASQESTKSTKRGAKE